MPLLRPRVVTASDVAQGPAVPTAAGVAVVAPVEEDSYLLKLTKYIPAEIVAVYQFTSGMLVSWQSPWSPWVCVGWVTFLAIFTAVWIPYATSDPAHNVTAHKFQVYSGVIAFLVWAFALGGAWQRLLAGGFAEAQPVIGALALGAATLLIPLLEKILTPPKRLLPRLLD
jgi:hypothetical protein